jgi:hypothetical protein
MSLSGGGKTEAQIQAEIMAECSNGPTRLWRTNAGMGWAGRMVSNVRGTVTLATARPLHGMPEGWPDLTGFTVTPTGTVPVFVEVKDATGRVRPEQFKFLEFLRSMGCRAGVARSVEDARKIIENTC